MLFNQTQAAELLEVTPRTIRNYEKQGKLPPAQSTRAGKYYESRDLAKLLRK